MNTKPTPEDRMLATLKDGSIEDRLRRAREEGRTEGKTLALKMLKIGRVQATTAIRDRLTLAVIKQWMDVKREKLWLLEDQTWEDWAKPNLGYSYKHIDEAIKNVQAIGDELYEILEAIDVKQKDLVAMRRAIEHGAARIEGSALVIGRRKFDLTKDHKAIKEFVDELQATLTTTKEEAKQAVTRAKANQDEARDEAKTLQTALAQAQAELKKWKAAKAPDGIESEPERQLWQSLSTWWQQFESSLTLFAHHREQEQVSDAALSAFKGLLSTMRDELAETVTAIEADLQLERPTLRRVR